MIYAIAVLSVLVLALFVVSVRLTASVKGLEAFSQRTAEWSDLVMKRLPPEVKGPAPFDRKGWVARQRARK